ncbi:modification methylase [Candidatus Magnetoovum chiemensis]|nr:modification methylase [Candidatus Magnetoovum chiemensis]
MSAIYTEKLQCLLFDELETNETVQDTIIQKDSKLCNTLEAKELNGYFEIQKRRFLGNKYKLLGFIEEIVNENCGEFKSLCDIFAGTGVVGERFNKKAIKIISNDTLMSNYFALATFLLSKEINLKALEEKIAYLNSIEIVSDNYFSENYGNRFFTIDNARKIGYTREEIERIASSEEERNALITSLIYATDKVANTVGHYDAFRKKLDNIQPIKLLTPKIYTESNENNEVFYEDANALIRKIECDVLYIDPPYNSRHYCDAYHLLENLARWEKPLLYGKAGKMMRTQLKSIYCLKNAFKAFDDLIKNAKCRHILVSYNNTGTSKDARSNARISDNEIVRTLRAKGRVEIFERNYKAFTTGKSETNGHTERVFYCNVAK